MSGLNNCSPKISKEHYISKGILREIGENSQVMTAGLPFLGENEKMLRESSLTSKVLCEYHNNELSPLDSTAIRFINTLKNFEIELQHSICIRKTEVFCGEDIESWALKTLCGMLASGNVIISGEIRRESVPQLWVDLLSGKQKWPRGWGLYLHSTVGQQNYSQQSFAFQAGCITNNSKIDAARFWFHGLPFVLLLHTPQDKSIFGHHHPGRIIWMKERIKRILEFSWQRRTGLSSHSFDFVTSGTGKSPLGYMDDSKSIMPVQALKILRGDS
ncbi:hypothetical protein ACINK0_10805 [Deinococcus sp. VB343]|uniref:hypothetical protein n=1 Tax=Deinococcus sp. VB343 TaxID=3385567 RepID=UPI0039C92A92